ncbi:MAG: hypothetical protein JOY68_09705 [Candidatus Dormibacteraeota bacterium]|nr:hypothetical protein [Candidatus Dormibacteraeota bacterium]
MAEWEALVAELMRAPLDAFVEERSRLVRTLRSAGRRDEATKLAALRKPSLVLWALNQAAPAAPEDVAALRAAGAGLEEAQQRVLQGEREAAPDLQRSLQEQRRAVDTVVRRLGMVLTGAGHAAADATLRRVADDLRSLSVGDEAGWTALLNGHLTAEPGPALFPAMTALRAAPPPKAVAEVEDAEWQRRLAKAEDVVRNAEAIAVTAREHEEAARRRAEQAATDLEAARATLDELRSRKG